MGRTKGSKMTEEQKAIMKAKRAERKQQKTGEKTDSRKAIADAFKHLYKTIEIHAGEAGEEIIDSVKTQVANLSGLTEQKLQEARKKAIDLAEENVQKAQRKLEELRQRYNS